MSNTRTYTLRESEIDRRWYVVDAADQTLGRLASRIARVLEGKNKPTYTPSMDFGRPRDRAQCVSRGGDPGQARDQDVCPPQRLPAGPEAGDRSGICCERRPEEVIRRAVKGMLPRNRLGAQQLRKLKIYAGPDHPHQAQRPEPLA